MAEETTANTYSIFTDTLNKSNVDSAVFCFSVVTNSYIGRTMPNIRLDIPTPINVTNESVLYIFKLMKTILQLRMKHQQNLLPFTSLHLNVIGSS